MNSSGNDFVNIVGIVSELNCLLSEYGYKGCSCSIIRLGNKAVFYINDFNWTLRVHKYRSAIEVADFRVTRDKEKPLLVAIHSIIKSMEDMKESVIGVDFKVGFDCDSIGVQSYDFNTNIAGNCKSYLVIE